MKPEVTASVKEMVRISSELDNKGYGEISGSINKFASNMIKDQFDKEEYEKIAALLSNSKLAKEAQMWDKMKGFMGGALGKVKEMATDIWQAGQAGGLEAQYGALYQQILNFKKKVDELAAKAQDPNLKQQMTALSQNIDLGGQQIQKAVTNAKQKTKKPTGAPTGQVTQQQKVPTSNTPQLTPELIKQYESQGYKITPPQTQTAGQPVVTQPGQ